MAGTAGGEVKCVQEHLPGQAEDHQLVVQILLAALGDLPWPRPCTLRHAHALAHPDHLLVVCILLLNWVYNEPPLKLSVPCCPRPDKWLHQLTGRMWGLLGDEVIMSSGVKARLPGAVEAVCDCVCICDGDVAWAWSSASLGTTAGGCCWEPKALTWYGVVQNHNLLRMTCLM